VNLNNETVKYLKKNCSDKLVIPITDEQSNILGSLSLICEGDEKNKYIVESLTKWRAKYMKFFLTQFVATFERTQNWLRNTVLTSDDRLLFLIFDETGRLIGNFGVANISGQRCELDNLIRGERGGHQKLIYYSELSLLRWAFYNNAMEFINLHVFSNNTPTIRLHTSVGFKELGRNKLFKFSDDYGVYYSLENGNNSGEITSFEYIEMGIDASTFDVLHK